MTDNYDAKAIASYETYYYRHDPWAARAAKLALGAIVTSADLISDDEFVRTEFYQDWLARRVFYVLGSVFPVEGGQLGALGIHRSRADGPYGCEEKRLAEKLLPHPRRSLQLRYRLSEAGIERKAALEALDHSCTAVIVVGGDTRTLYANRQAEVLFRDSDAIRLVAGRLTATRQIDSERLKAIVHSAGETAVGRVGSSGAMLLLERDGKLPLTIMAAPFRPALDGIGAPVPAVILFIRDPEYPCLSIRVLQDLFGLMPAEAAIARGLAEGRAVAAIAAALSVSINTVRTHLKNVLAKTATTRQAQLVALILRSVAVLAD